MKYKVMCQILSALALSIFMVSVSSAEVRITSKKSNAKAGDKAMIDHKVKNIDGTEVDLTSYRGKTLLIVNTASYCGYTRQYADLKKLQDQYAKQGFTV